MNSIKIFVSHRIDLESEIVATPIYIPVRCGAVYDTTPSPIIAGDDTGDNISRLRMSYCEFTVQYWAWKNVEADYYGLCHYRRYMSFAKKRFKTNGFNNLVTEQRLTDHEKKKYGLLNTEYINSLVPKYDIVVPEPVEASKMSNGGVPVNTVREMWESYNDVYFKQGTVDKVFELIKEYFPQYYNSACDYFNTGGHRAFNCYVMKKELFFRMCDFEFRIMDGIAKSIDSGKDSGNMQRAVGYVGEMLNGIFIHHIINEEHCSVKETQLVFFNDTNRIHSKKEYRRYRIHAVSDKAIRCVADKILPMYSPRREKIKKLLFGKKQNSGK